MSGEAWIASSILLSLRLSFEFNFDFTFLASIRY